MKYIIKKKGNEYLVKKKVLGIPVTVFKANSYVLANAHRIQLTNKG